MRLRRTLGVGLFGFAVSVTASLGSAADGLLGPTIQISAALGTVVPGQGVKPPGTGVTTPAGLEEYRVSEFTMALGGKEESGQSGIQAGIQSAFGGAHVPLPPALDAAGLRRWSTLRASLTYRRDSLLVYNYELNSNTGDWMHLCGFTEEGRKDPVLTALVGAMDAPQMGYWSDSLLTTPVDITATRVGGGLGILLSSGSRRKLLWSAGTFWGLVSLVGEQLSGQDLVDFAESIR